MRNGFGIRPGSFAIVGAAESTDIGSVPHLSSMGLALDGAANALADAGLKAADVDGLAVANLPVGNLVQQLGLYPRWVDGTSVGGCSWMFHLRSAMAAIQAGYCSTVLIVYGESGRSHATLPSAYDTLRPGSIEQQFDIAYAGASLQAALFGLPLARYMATYGLTEAQIAMVPVVQREWAALNPRAKLKNPTTVDEVLASPMVAWPIRRSMYCLVSDAGGAIVVTSADRAKDFAAKPVYVLGSGSAIENGPCSPAGTRTPMEPDFIRTSARDAFSSAGLSHSDIDHLMIYDAFAHNPIFGLEGLGFVPVGEAGRFIEEGHTRPGGRLPMNTNGGGLAYAHSGSYGMLCMLEGIRQMRGEAPAQIPGARTSLVHGWGGFGLPAPQLSSPVNRNECGHHAGPRRLPRRLVLGPCSPVASRRRTYRINARSTRTGRPRQAWLALEPKALRHVGCRNCPRRRSTGHCSRTLDGRTGDCNSSRTRAFLV
jgi:acetyl-CoA acetyltransferase